MAPIRTRTGPAGEILHLIPHPPAGLPPVTKRDLEQAWEAASARGESFGPARGFCFTRPGAEPLNLMLNDPDAANWAAAIGRAKNFETAHGISVCLRLMALVEFLGSAGWVRPWLTFNRDGLTIHPALWQAAALAPLTETGGFAETALRALLPPAAPDPESPHAP
jgi:hypothetical protein